MNVDFFGGPTVTPYPYLSAAAGHAFGSYNNEAGCEHTELFASVGWGVDANVSAALDQWRANTWSPTYM